MAVLLVVLGAFAGRLAAHQVGGSFAVPQAPNPSQWRIISPGLQEGVGPAGAGRVTHVRGGVLSIATHVFFRPDMVVPQFQGVASTVSVELDPASGTLWIQAGEAPSQFVQLRPGAMKGGAAGTAWTPTDSAAFELRIDGGALSVASGDTVIDVGPSSPGRLELSASEDWPRIRSLRVRNAAGVELFSSDFGDAGTPTSVLNGGTALGAAVGVMAALLLVPFAWTGLAAFSVGIAAPIAVLSQPARTWLLAVERLYLSQVQPSQWAQDVLLASLLPLAWMAAVAAVRRASAWPVSVPFAPGVWVAFGAASMAVGVRQWSLGLGIIVVCMGFGALRLARHAPASWWLTDALAWLPVAMLPPAMAAGWVVLWRLATLVGMAGVWLDRAPRQAVESLFVALLALPVALECVASASDVGQAWQMGRLSAERPNERGWENPRPGWQAQCGGSDPALIRTVAFAGGSSVGGAYQFGDEPEAFFPAVAHAQLCTMLPDGAGLVTQNFGDGDLNTFTISRTLTEHLRDADLLVMYVGVNDVLTRQNTKTRKQREAARSARSPVGDGLAGWVSSSTMMTGLSLWTRGIEDPSTQGVADVPLADARENHASIVAAAAAQSARVVLMTEHVHSGLLGSLQPYRQMQKSFVAEGVTWVDAAAAFEGMEPDSMLVDRNHLSREGNAILGRHVADEVFPLLYGSTR